MAKTGKLGVAPSLRSHSLADASGYIGAPDFDGRPLNLDLSFH